MRLLTRSVAAAVVVGMALCSAAGAQDRAPGRSANDPAPNPTPGTDSAASRAPYAGTFVPLRVQLVLSRFDGDHKISSQPYTLSVNAGPPINAGAGTPSSAIGRLRMGAEVPVAGLVPASPDGKPLPVVGPVQYKVIGTNIDCIVHVQDDGRYRLEITIEDSSVYASDKPLAGTIASTTTPVFRSFKLTNAVILKDGQSSQFTAATDKITGEVVKVDVTLNVVK